MTLFLSDREADFTFPSTGKPAISCPQTTECKLILEDPKQQSQGYRQRFEFASGLSLLIDCYKLHENLLVEAGGYEGYPEPDFELSFTLTGNNETEEVFSGQNFISTQIDEPEGKEFLWRSHQQILKIDVHISQKFFRQFGCEFLEASQQPPQTPPTSETQTEKPSSEGDQPIELVVTGEQDGYRVQDATTATRTDTPLRDIPQSIQVIPRQVLEDRNVKTVTEAVETVSGVTSADTVFNAPGGSYTIRGFEQAGNIPKWLSRCK
ncbi:MAG: TonB-dependent receptor plug domain-containing protein [Nostoc sp.]|uniref:TonB-dependent receptor plug domain-containing protein n=1 Tax=Nostoc sp. TaxID=1180 RepID=UPI002FFB9A88